MPNDFLKWPICDQLYMINRGVYVWLIWMMGACMACHTSSSGVHVHFGVRESGSKDIIPFIEDAVKNGARKISIAKGEYQIGSLLEIDHVEQLKINGHGSIFKLTSLPEEKGPAILKIYKSSRIEISGINIDQQRDNYSTDRLLHSVFIYDSDQILLKDLHIRNSLGDGIQIASDPQWPESMSQDIELKNCHIERSTRNGLSLVNGKHIRILHSSFTGSQGASPQAGIDIEADDDTIRPGVEDILISHVLVSDNTGNGIAIPHIGAPRDIRITGCRINNNLSGIWTCGVNVKIEHNDITQNLSYGICSIRYPEFDIPVDQTIISRNHIAHHTLGIYYRGSQGLIEHNVIENTTAEGIEARKENADIHAVTIRHNTLRQINGYSAIASDFDSIEIETNRIEDCKENGISVHGGVNYIHNNHISTCGRYSVLVMNAFADVSQNTIVRGNNYYIWFNGDGDPSASGRIMDNKIKNADAFKGPYILDTGGNISTYMHNRIAGTDVKKGAVILRKQPVQFIDNKEVVEIRREDE